MPLSTDPFDATELAAMIPEVWQPMILRELFAKTVAANFFKEYSNWAADGGDIIHIPDVTAAFTKQTQSTQTTEVTTDAPAQTDISLTINTHEYIAWLIGDKDMRQLARNLYDVSQIYTEKAVSTLADSLEDALFALWSGLSTNVVGDTATVLSDAEVRQGIEKLATANFPTSECAFFLHPYVFWVQLGAVAKYYDASQAGMVSNPGFVRQGNFGAFDASRGLVGLLYGMPIYTSSNVVSNLLSYRNLLAHPTAFGFAVQTPSSNGRVRVQADYLLQNLATLAVADILHGVVETRDAAAVVLNASTSFIGS